ncbi:MAG TPA: prepilin-type N-terminal cleavage/methylation domain-containing protein [Phycisphaerae bacterium]|nr:prepilin-type N-terminal cleavage/methylation domain-containing protein [Phycisphaerae bacterium]
MPAGSDKQLTPRTARRQPDWRERPWCDLPLADFPHPAQQYAHTPRRRGFTLLEWLISILILGILASLSTLLFRKAAEGSIMAQSRNAVITYAQVARSYAIAHHIETMLVVNPFNGRFEIWYSNPPLQGGAWNLQPSAVVPDSGNVDSYAFAPILDPSARLPRIPRGDEPAAMVNPIDYQNRLPGMGNTNMDMDNLTWAAFCFDESGQLVIRTRRIATRTFYLRNGSARTPANCNRLRDETPDLTLSPLVNATGSLDTTDTPITSTCGFVISDITKMKQASGASATDPNALVNNWLALTSEGQPYQQYAQTIVLNRFTGQQLLKGVR